MNIILAVGHSQVEASIEKQLPDHCEVVSIATYREAVITKLREFPNTDVVLIRDNLAGDIKILSLIHQIRAEFNNCRIVLMTKHREAGDPFLAAVVSYAVWDIILGYKVSVSTLVDYILNPRTFKDVERFQKRVLIDETTQSPTPEKSEKETKTPTSSAAPFIQESSYPNTPYPESQGNTSFPEFVSQPEASRGVFVGDSTHPPKGSMREQLFKQMESKDIHSASSISMEEPFTFEPQEQPLFENSFSFSTEPSQVSTESAVTPDLSFTLNESSPVSEPAVPKFEFKMTAEEVDETPKTEPKKPKLFSTKDMESIDKPLVGHRPAFNNQIKNSPVVMSLVGFKGGVGTSHTAFNLAVQLAKHKNRVLYVELNDHSLPLTYLYNLSTLRGGLEDVLRAAQSSDVQNFSAYVTRFKTLKETQREKEMQALLKPYPDTLDFISFSHFFVCGEKEEYYPEHLKGVLTDLLLSEGYQYIILDVNIHSNPTLVSQALRSSKYICPVITQDMVSVGQSVECLKAIHQHQFPLQHKVQYVLNRYDSSCRSDKSILKWITHELPFKPLGIWTIPENASAYNKANDKSKPVVLSSPPKAIVQAFETLHNYLKTM